MNRDLRTLADTRFDLLVIGAGIYGAAIAWDASQRGLSVAVIDRGDFGGGTSGNSAKTVHGGVRALQSGNLAELRSFVRERRALCRIAPHLVDPLPFVVPTYRTLKRSRLAMRLGFGVYDLLSRDRNETLDPTKHLPPSRLLSRQECLRLNPVIAPDDVTGGVFWHDCQMYNADRVTLSFIMSAVDRGAIAANYLDAIDWLHEGEQIAGVTIEDRAGPGTFPVRARLVINAAGPWSRELATKLPRPLPTGHATGLSMAMNLVTRPVTDGYALSGVTHGRFLFAVPWRDVSIVGTSHDPFDGHADSPPVTRDHVTAFLQDVNVAFPRAKLNLADVRLVHRGLLPATDSQGHTLSTTSQVRDHRQDGVSGLMSVVGVRYTTARGTAQRAVDTAFRILGHTPPPCRSAVTPLVGGDIEDYAQFLHDATTDPRLSDVTTLRRLARSYGS
ncbi:MAG: FAD-dependent oxidoreductase, partial [Acidobacteriota bacterium]|nr:FAD-dependent oxidoreductase [Acidobacteriota bacterium]